MRARLVHHEVADLAAWLTSWSSATIRKSIHIISTTGRSPRVCCRLLRRESRLGIGVSHRVASERLGQVAGHAEDAAGTATSSTEHDQFGRSAISSCRARDGQADVVDAGLGQWRLGRGLGRRRAVRRGGSGTDRSTWRRESSILARARWPPRSSSRPWPRRDSASAPASGSGSSAAAASGPPCFGSARRRRCSGHRPRDAESTKSGPHRIGRG